jgi:hypothetical protein|tara:strand:- start:381 stop:812 length:432 start_codon:yes stop_codon:yes gene_type:complete
MSWGTCYKASNNIHAGFPAMMSEGNLYTDYDSACKMNNILKDKIGVKSNYQYRQWLINNGTSVMKSNSVASCSQCCGCLETFNPVPNSNKYLFTSCADKTQPFGYETSDLKNLYLSRSDLQSRLCAPIMTQDQMLQMGKPNYN